MYNQNTSPKISTYLRSSGDHLTNIGGVTPILQISKAGGAWVSISRTVEEIGSGWYSVQLTSDDTDTIGDFILRVTGDGADPTDIVGQISASISSGGSSLSPSQATMLSEMYELLGLDPTKPLVVTQTQRVAGDINQTIVTSSTETIVTRS